MVHGPGSGACSPSSDRRLEFGRPDPSRPDILLGRSLSSCGSWTRTHVTSGFRENQSVVRSLPTNSTNPMNPTNDQPP